jgi:hypothetical protein
VFCIHHCFNYCTCSVNKQCYLLDPGPICYTILACPYEIQTNTRPEKYNSIYYESQAALKALQSAKIMSPLVQQCQKALNDISTQHTVELFWVPEYSGLRGIQIADKHTRDGAVQKFVGYEMALGISR